MALRSQQLALGLGLGLGSGLGSGLHLDTVNVATAGKNRNHVSPRQKSEVVRFAALTPSVARTSHYK